MDYEKLHNKTLRNLQEMVSKGKITEDVARGICADFVIENEDEKIRKWIYGIIKNICWSADENAEKELEIMQPLALAWLEKQGKQKHTDNVEPKFREEEWLCENEPNNYARFIQILEIVNVQGKDRYRISRDLHNDEDIVEFNFVEKYYHKFDIKDAKVGDVLVADPIKGYSSPFIAIYKELEQDCFAAYCIVSHAGEFYEGGNRYRIDAMRPATKEESDLLFQKIKEAGYKWNPETKELIVVQKNYEYDFGWCMECIRSMWIADAFEDPEEVYCTKKKIEIKRGDKIDCPYLK